MVSSALAKGGLLRRHFHGVGQPHVEAGIDNRHQAASGVHIGVGDAQTLTQGQHLEVAVGYARQSSQRHRVVIGARRDAQQARRIGRRAVLAPEVHFIAGRQQRGPVRLMRRPATRVTRQIVGVAGRVDTGKYGGMRLPGARIGLCDPRPCGAHVKIVAARLLDQAVQFGAAETPVPVPGRPCRLFGRQRLFKRRGHRDRGGFRRLKRTPRTDPGDEN